MGKNKGVRFSTGRSDGWRLPEDSSSTSPSQRYRSRSRSYGRQTPTDGASSKIDDQLSTMWSSKKEQNIWLAGIEKEINSFGLDITVDPSLGHIELPGQFKWKLPGLGWRNGPVTLDDRKMFRYTDSGNRDDLAEGGGGSNSIIIFGERLNGGERVIARMQGMNQTPDTLDPPMEVPSIDQIRDKISEFIKDTMWHTKVHKLGLAGEIYSTTIMPWKSSPIDCNNVPALLQISAAQQMDLETYFKMDSVSEAQTVHAFKMFIERYMKLLEAGICQIDMKPKNITVNLSGNDVTELLFIDIDDEWTYNIARSNQKQITIYWLAAMLQVLYPMRKYANLRKADPNRADSNTLLRQTLTEFIEQRPWMRLTWDAFRNMEIKNGVPTNPVCKLFVDIMRDFDDEDAAPTFRKGSDKDLGYCLDWYIMQNYDYDRGFLKFLEDIREIAAKPRFDMYEQFIHDIPMGVQFKFSSSTDDWGKRPRPKTPSAPVNLPIGPGSTVEITNRGDPNHIEAIKKQTGFSWYKEEDVNDWYDEIEAEIQRNNLDMTTRLDPSTGYIELPAGFLWNVPGVGWKDGPVVMSDVRMFRYNPDGRLNQASEGAGGSFNIVVFGVHSVSTQRVIARLQGLEATPYSIAIQPPPTLSELQKKIFEFIRDTVWHEKVHKLGYAGKNYSTVIMPWKSSPLGANNIPCRMQISEAQDQDLSTYMKSPRTTDQQGVAAFELFITQYLDLLQNGIAQIDMKCLNMTVNVNSLTNDVTRLCFIDIDDDFTCSIAKTNKTQVTVYWMAAVIQTLCIMRPRSSPLLREMITRFLEKHAWMNVTWDQIRNADVPRQVDHDKAVFVTMGASTKSIAYSPNGEHIVIGIKPDRDKEEMILQIRSARDGKAIRTIGEHEKQITAAVYSPDGTFIASASADMTVRVWDAQSGALVRALEPSTDTVWAVAWSPDSKYLVSGGADNAVRIWNLETGKHKTDRVDGPVYSVAWSPDGNHIAAGVANKVLIWDTASGARQQTLTGHAGDIVSIAYSPNSSRIMTVGGAITSAVRIWDAQTGQVQRVFGYSKGILNTAAWSPDGKHIVACNNNWSVLFWEVDAKKETPVTLRTGGDQIAVAWSPDSTHIALANSTSVIQSYNVSKLLGKQTPLQLLASLLTTGRRPNYFRTGNTKKLIDMLEHYCYPSGNNPKERLESIMKDVRRVAAQPRRARFDPSTRMHVRAPPGAAVTQPTQPRNRKEVVMGSLVARLCAMSV